jgi:hypothetical protein
VGSGLRERERDLMYVSVCLSKSCIFFGTASMNSFWVTTTCMIELERRKLFFSLLNTDEITNLEDTVLKLTVK